jgi:hypothetical protein
MFLKSHVFIFVSLFMCVPVFSSVFMFIMFMFEHRDGHEPQGIRFVISVSCRCRGVGGIMYVQPPSLPDIRQSPSCTRYDDDNNCIQYPHIMLIGLSSRIVW